MIYDQDDDAFAVSWEWPSFEAFGILYEPCEFGCELGLVDMQGNLTFTCPVCAGSGFGVVHRCGP